MGSKAQILIGTSGWHYPHWTGPVYPKTLDRGELLGFYAERLPSVEVNNTFYKLPSQETIAGWCDETPNDFVFACKASRYITHMKKLKEPRESTRRFFETIAAFGSKLGPVLFQLPPRWRVNADRLEEFLDVLPDGHRYAFEFRDPSWFDERVYQLLRDHGAAFCLYDLAGMQSPVELTADLVYIRLHGPGDAYQGSYDGHALRRWARRIEEFRGGGTTVHCYFDNDDAGYAFANAERLRDLVSAR